MTRSVAFLAVCITLLNGVGLLSSPDPNPGPEFRKPAASPEKDPPASQPAGQVRVRYTHPATGFRFPAVLGQFRYDKVIRFIEDVNVGVTYVVPDTGEITVYVYPAPGDARGPRIKPGQTEIEDPSEAFTSHFEGCKDAVCQAKGYTHLRDRYVQVNLDGAVLVGRQATFGSDDGGISSRLLLFRIRGHYLKVRMTERIEQDQPRLKLPLTELLGCLPVASRGLPTPTTRRD